MHHVTEGRRELARHLAHVEDRRRGGLKVYHPGIARSSAERHGEHVGAGRRVVEPQAPAR